MGHLFTAAAVALLACGSMMLALVWRARHRGELGGDLAVGAAAGLILAGVILASLHLARWLLPTAPGWATIGLTALGTLAGAVVISLGSVRRPFATLTFSWWGMPLPLTAVALEIAGWSGWIQAALVAALAAGLVGALLRAPRRPRPSRARLAVDEPGDLVLLTWNIGQGPPDNGPSKLRQLGHVAQAIRGADADVACLQEVRDSDHLALLLEHLGSGWRGHLATTERPKVCAVLTRLPGQLASPPPGYDARLRGPAALRLEWVEILSLHLPTHSARDRGAVLDWVVERWRRSDRPLLAVGDFNMDPDGYWDLCTTLFTDDAALDRRSLDRLCDAGQDLGAGTAATAVPSRRLDHVVVDTALQPVSYEVLFGAARGLMDHQPVVVRLRAARRSGLAP
jgi:endonuclease/exonuclease/phosphatase family metal-dependent hydrolase